MINFLQVPPVEPQPGFMQQYSFIIMIGLMVLVLWLFMWRPESKRRKPDAAFREGLKKGDKVITAGRHLRHGERDQGDNPADRGGRQRHAAHRQEHGRSRQQRPSAPVKTAFRYEKSCKFLQLFYLQVQIFYFTFAYLSGKPGHSPNNIVEGGGNF